MVFTRYVSYFLIALALATILPSGASAQLAARNISDDLQRAIDVMNPERLNQIALIAQNGQDARVIASQPETGGQTPYQTPVILVSIDKAPSFAYQREKRFEGGVEAWRVTFAMRCRGNGQLDLLFSPVVSGLEKEHFPEIRRALAASPLLDLNLSAYGQDAHAKIPGALFITDDSHALFMKAVGTTSVYSPFFAGLRGTSNLSAKAWRDGLYGGITKWADLSTFRTSIAPLLEHCKITASNPLDGYVVHVATGTVAQEKPKSVDLDLSFVSGSAELERIYRGDPMPLDFPLYGRMTRPLAYQVAFYRVCGEESNYDMSFHAPPVLDRHGIIGVANEDYAGFVVLAAAYEQASHAIYRDTITRDFSFDRVMQLNYQSLDEYVSKWASVLHHYGCDSDVERRFRDNLRREMPYLEYADHSKKALLDFNVISYSLNLPEIIDITQAASIGLAERNSISDRTFNDSYPGRVLRAVAIGNFYKVRQIEADLTQAFASPFKDNGDTIISQAIELVGAIEHSGKRQSNIFTAYAIARSQLLGSCGDLMTTFSQDTLYWTEYSNVFGQYQWTTPGGQRTDMAEVPHKFARIIEAQSSISTSDFLANEMASMLRRMTCDNPIREQLEANIIAYFEGRRPEIIGALP